jgi:hypothetical protein
MKKNRGVVYKGPGVVAVEEIPYPVLELKEQNRKCPHGVIVKVDVILVLGLNLFTTKIFKSLTDENDFFFIFFSYKVYCNQYLWL